MSADVKGVLFDMDGLLLDTEIIYTQVTQEIVGRFGRTFDWSVKANMIGRPAMEAARYLASTLDLPISAEDYLNERDTQLRNRFPACSSLPGAQKLVRHLHGHRVPIAVASSSSHEMYRLKTRNHQSWFSLFDVVVTADDPAVGSGKPAPDIFLVAASRLNIPAQSALVFEDAPSGLQAGIKAGMQVIVIPDPNMDRARYRQATQILDTLAAFRPEDFGLPPVESQPE